MATGEFQSNAVCCCCALFVTQAADVRSDVLLYAFCSRPFRGLTQAAFVTTAPRSSPCIQPADPEHSSVICRCSHAWKQTTSVTSRSHESLKACLDLTSLRALRPFPRYHLAIAASRSRVSSARRRQTYTTHATKSLEENALLKARERNIFFFFYMYRPAYYNIKC
jgi:hypothetical protein